jgi:O-acetyl-ADP-ribose deacetylase (regulator of RNase III)
MISFTRGDILNSSAEALVNTVNCVGIMGRGIALQFKNAFPENFRLYADACARGEVQPGKMFVVETGQLTSPRWIVNFPTKRHWKGNSKIGDISAGLDDLKRVILARGIRSIAIPPLGSGLGGLPWPQVRSLIERSLRELPDLDVTVFEPIPDTQRRSVVPAAPPHMTAGRAALVALVYRYLAGLLDPTVTLLEMHKLMYFMQVAGERLRLTFEKAHYGPYATNLRHVLHAIEGYYVSGYLDGGDNPEKTLLLVPGAYDEARTFLSEAKETTAHLDRVGRLVEGFEAPYGMELLASVHWVAEHEDAHDPDLAHRRIVEWNARKAMFTKRQVGLAFDRLNSQGWV